MIGKNRRLIIILSAILVVLVFVLVTVAPAGRGGKQRLIQIHKGSSAGDIGHLLASRHIIRSEIGFRLLARVLGYGKDLKPGVYKLSASMSPVSILRKIAAGDVSARWVTFPEGFTINQMGERLEAEHLGSADAFIDKALHHGKDYATRFPHPGASLEGFLFPDTYLVSLGGSGDELIREMLDAFQEKVAGPLSREIATSDLKLRDAVTLASLIEREAKVPGDRALISSVLRNRLKKHMYPDCDATIMYAEDRRGGKVLFKDLDVSSKYNTYRNYGLPPGPIANPGIASIKAALVPAKSDFLYYVAKPDGSHIFSRTFEEHKRAKRIANSL